MWPKALQIEAFFFKVAEFKYEHLTRKCKSRDQW